VPNYSATLPPLRSRCLHWYETFYLFFVCCCTLATSGWSSWSNYGPCSTYCLKNRQRFCTSSDFSKDCPGADQYGVQQESVQCTNSECYGKLGGYVRGISASLFKSSLACNAGVFLGTHGCQNLGRFIVAAMLDTSAKFSVNRSRHVGLQLLFLLSLVFLFF